MVLLSESKAFDVVLPVHSEGNEPLCTWFSKAVCLPIIRRLLAEGLTCPLDIFPQVRVGYLEVEKFFPAEPMGKVFANLNSPTDYDAARREKAAKIEF